MELRDYLRVLRKRWLLILVVTLVTLGVAALATVLSPKVYSAQTQFFVSTSGGDNNAGQLLQGNTFTQQRVKSYAQLLETPKILAPVIDKLGLTETPDQLAARVTATVPLDTVLIEVTVTDGSPARAALIAKALGEQFPATIEELEKVAVGQPSPVKVTLVREPQEDSKPISPKPAQNLALGLVLGLLLGFGAALLRDLLDTTIKSSRDLEGVTDETVIWVINFDSDASEHPLIVQVGQKGPRSEAFRSLRTNLQFVDAANHPKSIVVTSSLPGEGKTTTTANLALTLAAGGARVCVVEGDLRRPRLLEYLGYEGAVGLTDVLIGRADLTDVLQQFGSSNLWVLGSGGIPPNPSELLGSAVMGSTLKALEARFDYVLIDAPPLLPVTDAAVLTTHAGGALVIVGAGIVTKDHLRRALEALEAVHGNTLGLVLNRLPRQEAGGYGTYSYDYADESPRARAKREIVGTVGSPVTEAAQEAPVPSPG
ncbi:MAG: polysaccharide biosynthesis tyrosine autokinase [Lapillicoccus sp.]